MARVLLTAGPRRGLVRAASAQGLVLGEPGGTRESLFCRTSKRPVTSQAVLIQEVSRGGSRQRHPRPWSERLAASQRAGRFREWISQCPAGLDRDGGRLGRDRDRRHQFPATTSDRRLAAAGLSHESSIAGLETGPGREREREHEHEFEQHGSERECRVGKSLGSDSAITRRTLGWIPVSARKHRPPVRVGRRMPPRELWDRAWPRWREVDPRRRTALRGWCSDLTPARPLVKPRARPMPRGSRAGFRTAPRRRSTCLSRSWWSAARTGW